MENPQHQVWKLQRTRASYHRLNSKELTVTQVFCWFLLSCLMALGNTTIVFCHWRWSMLPGKLNKPPFLHITVFVRKWLRSSVRRRSNSIQFQLRSKICSIGVCSLANKAYLPKISVHRTFACVKRMFSDISPIFHWKAPRYLKWKSGPCKQTCNMHRAFFRKRVFNGFQKAYHNFTLFPGNPQKL